MPDLMSVDIMTNNIANMPNTQSITIQGLASSYAAGNVIEEHSHNTHQIVHAISGAMRVIVKGAIWFLPLGRALWIPANTPHAIQCIGQVEMRTVYFSDTYKAAHINVYAISVSPLMREIMVRLAEGCNARQITLLKELLFDEIHIQDMEPLKLPLPNDPRIVRLATHMQDNPTDGTTLKNWAIELGFSQRSLIRSIRAETGMSFREFRRQIRVLIAIEKLSHGQSVTSVAYDVGFETPSAFIHAFRLVTGKTPLKYLS